MEERKINYDGSVQEPDGRVTLSVSLGLQYNVSEMLGRLPTTAVLVRRERVNDITQEIWQIPGGETFTIDQLSRFEFAELGCGIGSVRVKGEKVTVYQPIPRHLVK